MLSSKDLKFKAIIAMDESRVIGKDGTLPWHVPEDLRHFTKMTKGHAVLMGRKTYDSLPDKYKPLPGRKNIVLSKNQNLNLPKEVDHIRSIDELNSKLKNSEIKLPDNEIWVLGGASIYNQLFSYCDEIHLTKIFGKHSGDTYLDEFEDNFDLVNSVPGEKCVFETYKNKSTEDFSL